MDDIKPFKIVGATGIYKTKAALQLIGRSKSAVFAWIGEGPGQIADVKKDGKGDRMWTDDDIKRFRAFAEFKKARKLSGLNHSGKKEGS
jgi:hypothetical protein